MSLFVDAGALGEGVERVSGHQLGQPQRERWLHIGCGNGDLRLLRQVAERRDGRRVNGHVGEDQGDTGRVEDADSEKKRDEQPEGNAAEPPHFCGITGSQHDHDQIRQNQRQNRHLQRVQPEVSQRFDEGPERMEGWQSGAVSQVTQKKPHRKRDQGGRRARSPGGLLTVSIPRCAHACSPVLPW